MAFNKEILNKSNMSLMSEISYSRTKYGSFDDTRRRRRSSVDSMSHHHRLPKGESSIKGVLSNFLNALVGSGILAVPFVYGHSGLFGGLGLMVIFAIICTYTVNLLIQAAQNVDVHEYEELGYVSFGNVGYIAVSACMFLMDFGSMLNYLIILGDASYKVIQIWGYDAFYDRQFIIIVVAMVVIFPPCLFRDVSFYEKFSAVKLFAIALVIIIVIYQYFTFRVLMYHKIDGYTQKFIPASANTTWFDINGLGSAVGVVAYCFVCHDTAFIYYNTLFNPTIKRWSTLSFTGVSLAMLSSLLLSIPAYLTFGSDVDGNVLNNYAVNDPTIIFIRCIYVITMALTYPTAFFVVRHVVCASFRKVKVLFQIWKYSRNRKRIMNNNLQSDVLIFSASLYNMQYTVQNAPLWQHVMFSCLIFFANLAMALVVDNLGTAMGVIGSLSSVNLAFVLPCLCYVKSSRYGFLSFMSETKTKDKFKAWLAIYPPIFVAIFGFFVVVYGTVSTLFYGT